MVAMGRGCVKGNAPIVLVFYDYVTVIRIANPVSS